MPHSLIRWVSGAIILSMAGFLGYVLTQHVRSSQPPPVLTATVFENADAGIEGFVYRQTEEGKVQWEVEAQKARANESQHHVILESVHVRLFGKDGQAMELRAEEGTVDTASSDFDLRNRQKVIAIELANGYTILSPHIHWADKEQEIRTNTPVTIHGHGLIITGIGLIGKLTTETLTVLDDVRVHVAS